MSAPRRYIQTQPKLYRFTLRGFLSLPRRLCSPPAAVGKVRSFGLTPIFDVRLDDVLDRKHLPPLSLKDFEEWLLYVEQCAENLYFILWLREYSAKYDRWIAKVRSREAKARRAQTQSAYRVAWSTTTPTSPALALFFSRARETFLVPGAPYELALPPALLDSLAVAGHPDPAVLAPARAHIENALRASLSRCVRAAYSNVGAYRAACGIAAGIFILLVGTVPALAVNFVKAQSRWERLVVLPGLWLGLTVLIASLRGICMMIYIFGDFRQLRKFELVRPPPPASPRESESYEDNDDCTPTIAAPTRPVRALTAPPKIAIRIPTRTPTLSYGTTSISLTTDVTFSGTGTGTGTESSYTNTTHTHTISISSLKSRAGASSLVHGYGYGHADPETRSIPAYASDDESMGDGEGELEEEDAQSSASDHGIYISPAMPSPDVAAEDDPAVVNAALALIASGASNAPGGGPFPFPQSSSAPASVLATVPGPSGTAAVPACTSVLPAVASAATTQTPTASFIPAYSYSGTESAHRRRSRSVDTGNAVRDLEAGAGVVMAPALAAPRLGAFDFDALPPPPPPPPPLAVAPHPRTRAPDVYVDAGLGPGPGCSVDEKGLASPSGYGLGTECDPTSPARSDDVAGLCEKEPGSGSSASSRAWRHSRTGSRHSRFASFLRLPRLVLSPLSLLLRLHPSRSRSRSDSISLSDPNNDSRKGLAWRTRCALETRVPAFGPVTRVLAPVVARAQWEIVVRAAALAALLGAVVAGVVVALPVPHSDS